MSTWRDRLTATVDHVRRGLDRSTHTPLLPGPPSAMAMARAILPPEELERVRQVAFRDMGHGFDPFGMSRDGIAFGLVITHHLYRYWFRVDGYGREHIPAEGPVVLASNHSGTIPLDGLMICADILRKAPTPRVPRAVVDYFVGELPWISKLFTRAGAIGGARANFHELLSHGEMIVVFPEGTRGVGKPFADRYQLQRWTEGHAELAIRHQAPIVPVAVIGAEEQMPQIGRIQGFHAFGAPYLPVPATLVPLPVHYRIWYGEPMREHLQHPPEAANDPEVVAETALRVREAVQALIERGLAEREGVFL